MSPPPTLPVFASPDHDLTPVTGANSTEWMRTVLGGAHPDVAGAADGLPYSLVGTFVLREQTVHSVLDVNLQAVIFETVGARGLRLRTESYICVSGPGAPYVDVAVWPNAQPPHAGSETKYLGWKGSEFAAGAALPDASGNYWYRLDIDWGSPATDDRCLFFAKTYRYSGDTPPPFKIAAFQGAADTQTSIEDHKAYAFGTAPFTVMAVVGGTDRHVGTIAEKRCFDRPLTGWRLAMVQDPEGVVPGRYLSFVVQGATETPASAPGLPPVKTAVTQRHLARLSRDGAPQIRDATSPTVPFPTNLFDRFTHAVTVVREGAGCRMYLDGHLLDLVPLKPGSFAPDPVTLDVSTARPLRLGHVAPEPDADPDEAFLVRRLGLWTGAMTQAQIIDQLNAMAEPQPGPTCVGYWDLVSDGPHKGIDRSATKNDVSVAQRKRAQARQTVLPFYLQKQLQDNWCWSATSTAVNAFYYPLSKLEQCRLVAAMFTPEKLTAVAADGYGVSHIAHQVTADKPVCQNGDWYDYWFYLPPPLSLFKALKSDHDSQLALGTCLESTRDRRPFLVRVEWSGGAGHFIGVAGFYTKKVGLDEVQMVVIVDSINGVSEMPFENFTAASAYQSDGTWTHSFLTQGPMTADRPQEGD